MSNRESESLAAWQAIGEGWDSILSQGKIASRKVTNDRIINAILALDVNRVLDVGCGEGWLTRKLAYSGVETVGVDGSRDLIDLASRRAPDLQYVHSSYDNLSELSVLPKFDLLVCNFSIFDKNIEKLLLDMIDLLRHKGYILIQTIHPENPLLEAHLNSWVVEDWKVIGEALPSFNWYYRDGKKWHDLFANALLYTDNEETVEMNGVPFSMIYTLRVNMH